MQYLTNFVLNTTVENILMKNIKTFFYKNILPLNEI